MKSKITFLSLLAALFFIPSVFGQCITGGMYPPTAFTPACSGAVETINTDCWAGEYAEVNVLTNKQYTFSSSTATDYITVTDATGATIYVNGTSPVVWNSGGISGVIRYFIHKSSACVTENVGRIRYITCTTVASCGSPSGVFVTNITSNSARINWTAPVPAPASGYEYYFSTSNTTPLASTAATGSTPTAVVNVAGLSAGTTYYHWIRSNCTSIKSAWVAGGSFTTIPFQSCNGAADGLYPEATYTPLNTGSLEQIVTDSWAGEFTNVNIIANKQYTFTSSVATDYITITNATGTTVYATGTTPLVWNSGATTGVIRYHLHTNSACGTESVGRIRYITSIDSCSTPNTLSTTNVTSSSAILNWMVSNIPSGGYDYIVNTSNITPTNTSTPTANVNNMSALVAGLLPNTVYYWWVRSNCGTTKSAWLGPVIFVTLQNPGNGCTNGTLYPSATFTPSCSGNPELITNVAYGGEYTNISASNGTRLTFSSSNATDFITVTNASGTQVLAYGVSPVIYSIDSGATILRYYIHTNSSCGVENVNRNRFITCTNSVCPSPNSLASGAVTSNSALLSWSSITTPGSGYEYYIDTSNVSSPQYSTAATGTSTTSFKTVTGLTGSTTYYFWIRCVCSASSKSNWVYGGNFTTQAATPCSAPTGLSVSNVTSNSAYLNLTDTTPLPASGYQYYLNSVNVAPTGVTTPTGTFNNSTQSNVTGLNPNQTYFYWIRSACSASTQSAWVAGGSFTTVSFSSCNGTAGAFGVYPPNTFSPACSGAQEVISNSSWAGEFTNVTITSGKQYTFTSSVSTDYITITNSTGNTVYASGITPVTWYSGNNSGLIRYFIHTNSSCGSEEVNRTRSITCATPVISLVGEAASGWDTDIYMSTADGITYTLNNYTLATGGVKFRQDSSWVINWGSGTFPTGTGTQDGVNIPAVACVYNITFNLVTRAYSFVSTSSQPAKPTGTATQTFCNAATLSNVVVTGTNIKWYDFPTGGNLLASNTPLVNGTTYYASQSNGTCESLLRLAVTTNITVTAMPTAASTQTLCAGTTVAGLTATGTAIKWYNVPVNGSALASSTLLANGTYYVTQTLNSCESPRKAVTVTITPLATPTFTAVAPICSGATLAALPTTSNNGITGTWTPALNNTATTTYTFTPTAGQCALTTTLTITVNPNVTP
ncbi:MAG: hypothetical protein CFE23_01125, partial [Flavobacterium sp. BFFFF1]|uniref:fibronectin type III domain-containing protein n=1 Tax=Flavobacterium sp. BFFFF1 TaxID=2015557 RepID=UPI000BC742A6